MRVHLYQINKTTKKYIIMKATMDSKSIKQKEIVKAIIFSTVALVYIAYNMGAEFGKALHQLAINF